MSMMLIKNIQSDRRARAACRKHSKDSEMMPANKQRHGLKFDLLFFIIPSQNFINNYQHQYYYFF